MKRLHLDTKRLARIVILAAACLTCGGSALADADAEAVAAQPDRPLGLSVADDGTLLLEGRPFMGFGIQYHDCLRRRLRDPEDTSYREGFEELATYGIPFCRIMACGFWPVEMQLYLDDKDAYFAMLDDVVEAAGRANIGLIPSLFWYYACVPDLVGEPINKWGDPDSKTHAFMRRYVADVVTRYKDSPVIWAWEFGNEYNLPMDLPDREIGHAWTHPHLGTPAERTKDDVFRSEHLAVALRAFAEEVRRHDPDRMISTGHAIPRPAAHHLQTVGTWDRDTVEQFQQVLLDQNPDPFDAISMHVYPSVLSERYFGNEQASFEDVLRPALAAAKAAGKALFIGEFGAHDDERATREEARVHNELLFKALLELEVPLANYWVYDFTQQDSFINVTSTNHRSYVLDMLRDANETLRARMAADGE